MEITLILGNGFDLNLGMKTGYRDFYEDYIKIESNNKPIIKMKILLVSLLTKMKAIIF